MPLTISIDEDYTLGFMLTDDAPATAEERAEAWAEQAAHEWDLHFDPAGIAEQGQPNPRPYVLTEDEEMLREARDGEEPTGGVWWVFDLPDEVAPCALCGEYLTHLMSCPYSPELGMEAES